MGQIIIIMGVSGCGKSTIGKRLAGKFGGVYIEGDELHPPGNIDKMSAGCPLVDDDRWPWFDAIIAQTNLACAENDPVFVGCSALKEAYRQYLGNGFDTNPGFIHLVGSFETIHDRMKSREHFMPAKLLESQFSTLEDPSYGPESLVSVQIDQPIQSVFEQATEWMSRRIAAG